MPKPKSDVELMIAILEDAASRSDCEKPEPREFSEKRELALIIDMIDAEHIRGEILDSKYGGPARGAAMWGVTLSGRDYLQKLKSERDAQRLPAKLAKLIWAIGGWLVGILTAGIIALVSQWLKKTF